MAVIKKNYNGVGRNKTYNVGNRKDVSLSEVVKEIKAGKHPHAHLYTFDGIKFPRDNPDYSEKDNVNHSL